MHGSVYGCFALCTVVAVRERQAFTISGTAASKLQSSSKPGLEAEVQRQARTTNDARTKIRRQRVQVACTAANLHDRMWCILYTSCTCARNIRLSAEPG